MTTNIRLFTPADYPAIVNIHNSLNIVWPEQPRTPEGWAEVDRNRNPRCKIQRWVAIQDGVIAGYGVYWQSNFDYHPQRFYINVEVSPQFQRCGLGAALYDQILSALQPFDPRVLRANAFTNLPAGFPFLQQRGFYEAFRETPVHLDIAGFDPSPYADLEAKLCSRGVVIKTLREVENDPGYAHKLYDLYWEATADVPQEEPRIEQQEFAEWVKWGLNDPTILHDAYFVAICGDETIGLRELSKDPDNNILLGGLLGVRRDYRGQGIGLAMQLRGIAYCREHGYPQLKTCTAIQNAPMQAMFDKLGYARDPEWLQCQKNFVALNGSVS
ncbi:MAG: GNAT family N-acetyltransferase [Anaerolineales bacterium]|nr:GNAT family N-acetyltransferase [Anaerolineales bacterium]